VTLYALTDLGHQYLLYGAAAVICLAVFVTGLVFVLYYPDIVDLLNGS
jgi:hypothetical protein